jgi:hypothetical protein
VSAMVIAPGVGARPLGHEAQAVIDRLLAVPVIRPEPGFSAKMLIPPASSWEQVRREVWGEIRKALRGSQIQFPVPNQTEMTLAPDCYALGLSTNDATRIQGFHGNHVLVVIDEAPGLDVAIWEAIESARAGGETRVIALGNPTVSGGIFYDIFTKHRAIWKTFTKLTGPCPVPVMRRSRTRSVAAFRGSGGSWAGPFWAYPK